MAEPAHRLDVAEPMEPPPPAGTSLPKARLIREGEVASTHKQQQNIEDTSAAGTSGGLLLRLATGHVLNTDLVEDPLLDRDQVSTMLDMHRRIYNYTKVCILFHLQEMLLYGGFGYFC